MFPAGPEQQPLDQSDPHRTSTASSGTQCSPPDPNSKLRIRVVPAGPPPQPLDQSVPRPTSTASSGYLRIIVFPARPQQQPLDQSVPRRTSTASSGSECSPPDLNHKESPKIYQIECQKELQKIYEIKCESQIACQKICQNGDHSKKATCSEGFQKLT